MTSQSRRLVGRARLAVIGRWQLFFTDKVKHVRSPRRVALCCSRLVYQFFPPQLLLSRCASPNAYSLRGRRPRVDVVLRLSTLDRHNHAPESQWAGLRIATCSMDYGRPVSSGRPLGEMLPYQMQMPRMQHAKALQVGGILARLLVP